MLSKKTSTPNILRIESARRHDIRNLKAKVRSLLPPDVCIKEKRRNQHTQKGLMLQYSSKNYQSPRLNAQKQKDRRFDKLTKEDIDQINENKHYFLGSAQSIVYYDSYIKQNYPELTKNNWNVPKVEEKTIMPFNFINPRVMSSLDHLSDKEFTSEKKILDRRTSLARSTCHFRAASPPLNQQKIVSMKSNKMEAIINRKQQLEQEFKVRRQINSSHSEQQQKSASLRKYNHIKQKSQLVKFRYSANYFSKNNKTGSGLQEFLQCDIAILALKLRKICLKNKKRQLT